MQDYSGYGYGGPTAPLPPPPPPRRRAGLLSYVGVALAAGALGAGVVVALYHPASDTTRSSPSPSISAPAPTPSQAAPSPASGGSGSGTSEKKVYDKVVPGLVFIDTALQYSGDEAAGTGMVIKSDGLVLTNNHVIEDSTAIHATDLANGKTYTAKVVGYDVTGDVALIQLEGASGLPTVPIGNSGTVKAGQPVLAMGNAEGQNQIVVAAGTVTALDRTITADDEGGEITTETLHGMIADNAAIVQGDSGGPLADSAGQVIGMDTAGNNVSYPSGQSTAGFAIPINTALSVARQISSGRASSTISIGYPPFVGVFISQGASASPQSQAAAEQSSGSGSGFGGSGFGGSGLGGSAGGQGCYTSDVNLTTPSTIAPVASGTLVIGVICGSPAASAGLTSGSVITAVNGQPVGAPQSLTHLVSAHRPGGTISLTWVSPSGTRTTSAITLAAGPPL